MTLIWPLRYDTCVGIKKQKFEATWTKREESSSFTVLLSCATFDRGVLGDWMREGGEVVIRIKIASGCQRASGPVSVQQRMVCFTSVSLLGTLKQLRNIRIARYQRAGITTLRPGCLDVCGRVG